MHASPDVNNGSVMPDPYTISSWSKLVTIYEKLNRSRKRDLSYELARFAL